MRGCHQIVIFNNHVTHGACSHVQAERLPVIAIIKGNIDSALCCGKEHSTAHRIFTHGIHIFIGGNPVDDFCPGLAGIVRAQNVWTQIVQAERVDGRVRGLYVKVAGFND